MKNCYITLRGLEGLPVPPRPPYLSTVPSIDDDKYAGDDGLQTITFACFYLIITTRTRQNKRSQPNRLANDERYIEDGHISYSKR